MIKCSRPITRRLEWDSGHRVLGHEGKCACLHGHRYAAEVTFVAKELDDLGRVIDFGTVKTILGAWIDKHWDHTIILHRDDPLLKVHVSDLFGNKGPYIMPGGRNTTAEELAYELYTVCIATLPEHITVTRVRIFETPNCWADFIPHE